MGEEQRVVLLRIVFEIGILDDAGKVLDPLLTHDFKADGDYLVTVRDLMQHMNGRFDSLDPKKGASLSPTETLVSVHALTMLVDILAATEMEHAAIHPYNE